MITLTFILAVLSFQSEIHSYWLTTQYRIPVSYWQTNTVNGQFLFNRVSLSYHKELSPNIAFYFQGDLLLSIGDTISIKLLSQEFNVNSMKYLDTTITNKIWLIRGMVQRGYLSYRYKRLNTLIGRFLPTQGYGYFYSPTDIYRTRQKLSIDPEFLQGVDAFEVTVYPVPDGRVRFLLPFEHEKKPASLSTVYLLNEVEFFTALNTESPGFGFSLPFFEGLIRIEIAKTDNSISWDFTYDRFFQKDIYVLVEILRTKDMSFTGLPLPTMDEDVGITSAFIRKGFDSGVSIELTVMVSNDDGSLFIMPRISHDVSESLVAEGRVYLSVGKGGDIFDPNWLLPVLTFGVEWYF